MQRNDEYIYEDGRRPLIRLSIALAEVEETAELIYDEVEEATIELLDHYPIDTVPIYLILQTLLHNLLNCIHQVMDVDTVTVLLQVEGSQQLAVRASIGLEEEITKEIRIPIGHGFAGRIADRQELTIVDDLSTVDVVSPILRNKGLRSMLGVPLLVKGRVGVFHIGTVRPRKFTRNDARLMQLVADHIGLAINHLGILKLSTSTRSKHNVSKPASNNFALADTASIFYEICLSPVV